MRERNYQICRLLLLTDVIHYLDTSVAYRRLQQVAEDVGLSVGAAWIAGQDRSMWRTLRPSAGQAQQWVSEYIVTFYRLILLIGIFICLVVTAVCLFFIKVLQTEILTVLGAVFPHFFPSQTWNLPRGSKPAVRSPVPNFTFIGAMCRPRGAKKTIFGPLSKKQYRHSCASSRPAGKNIAQHLFSSKSGVRRIIPSKLGTVVQEVPHIFAPS